MKRPRLGVTLALTAALCATLAGCGGTQEKKEPDFSGVQAVYELTTLKCYYHNVAEGERAPDGPLGPLLRTGYKKVWQEYDGVVEVGVDVGGIHIGTPNAEGEVEVHVPEARVMNVYVDKGSINDPITETGFLTEVTTEEKTAAFQEAQKTMESIARDNKAMLSQAHERAKKILEGYVKNVGNEIGEKYTVKWV
ncbi:MAG: DUF4230 domain-containing protein [Atopobiaceae bacterium]|nr:DUF4230 domain-containing protein [Atopobiaceae bacterium]